MEHDMISIAGLPAGISEEILLRLPVKKLLQVRCVCKKWRDLIGSQGFIDRHYRHQSNTDNVVVNYRSVERKKLLRSRSQEANNLHGLTDVLGPVRGLFCEIYTRDMYLINPAMRQMKILPPLPPPPPNIPTGDDDVDGGGGALQFYRIPFGFGIDPITGDIKIVAFRRDIQNSSSKNNFVCVYRLSTDSWNFIEASDQVEAMVNACWSNFRAFSNGVHYWLVPPAPVEGGGFSILAFDMRSERFREVQTPRGLKRLELSVFDCPKLQSDRVAALVQIVAHEEFSSSSSSSIALLSNEGEWVDMWVMGEEEGSWTKKFKVGPLPLRITTLCMWRDEVVVDVGNDSYLNLYHVSTKRVRRVALPSKPIQAIRCRFLYSASSFKVSLVSVKGGTCPDSYPKIDYQPFMTC